MFGMTGASKGELASPANAGTVINDPIEASFMLSTATDHVLRPVASRDKVSCPLSLIGNVHCMACYNLVLFIEPDLELIYIDE